MGDSGRCIAHAPARRRRVGADVGGGGATAIGVRSFPSGGKKGSGHGRMSGGGGTTGRGSWGGGRTTGTERGVTGSEKETEHLVQQVARPEAKRGHPSPTRRRDGLVAQRSAQP